MPDTALASPGRMSPILIAVGVFGVLLAGAAALWAYNGTAVFYEMIVAGLAYCF